MCVCHRKKNVKKVRREIEYVKYNKIISHIEGASKNEKKKRKSTILWFSPVNNMNLLRGK